MSHKSSVLSKKDKIRQYLLKYAEGKYRNSVVEFIAETGSHILIIPSGIERFTERAQTMLVRRIGKDLEADVNITQASSINDTSLIAALHELLESKLTDNFVDVIASAGAYPNVDIIVFVKDGLKSESQTDEDTISKLMSHAIKPFGWHLDSVYFTELADRTPTAFQIVRMIYIHAPVTFGHLQKLLEVAGFPTPSELWLRRQLDSLVRKDFLCWQKGGKYVVTANGLALLPRIKGRNSPDVIRALELARKSW